MKTRFAILAGLTVILGALSVVGLAETGTITGNVATVMNVTFTNTLDLGSLTVDFNGITENKYLELDVNSNVDYTVQLSCDGNMGRVGLADDWRNEIETEYAIWKQITWNDYYTGADSYSGYVGPGAFKWYTPDGTDPTWFNAEIGGGKQGGDNEDYDFSFNSGFLPEHYVGASAAATGWPTWWDDNYYNYGADLTLKFYPSLDLFDDYGTLAGAYSATITVVITAVPSH